MGTKLRELAKDRLELASGPLDGGSALAGLKIVGLGGARPGRAHCRLKHLLVVFAQSRSVANGVEESSSHVVGGRLALGTLYSYVSRKIF